MRAEVSLRAVAGLGWTALWWAIALGALWQLSRVVI